MNERILLFVPCYNCEKQIGRVLSQLNEEVLSVITKVLIVNNRSTDKTEAVAIDYLEQHPNIPAVLVRNNENYGLGGSHKVAFQYAIEHGFDYVIVLHGDDQGDIANILPYLKNREFENYDCFLGARFMKGSQLQGYSKFRTFGNRVYNMLFSIGVGRKIYDLGSGLNMYKVDIFRDKFYVKYIDNLMFNYCMVMGSAFYNHKVKFFPIIWREDDQISNVKMVNQAITVLKLLASYVINKKKFVNSEHRMKVIDAYLAEVVFTNL